MGKTKGQYVRLFLSKDNTTAASAVIASAQQLTLHLSATVENISTKDTDSEWIENEVVAVNYDISTESLVRSGETISSSVPGYDLSDLLDIHEAGTPVKWRIANVSGDNNRTIGSIICSGSVVLASIVLNAPNRQTATWTSSMQGWGDIVVGN